jgi:CDP-diacylglycerol--serine O-phosphatidyltransferase
MSSFWTALYLAMPLVIGGILHMLAVRAHVLSILTVPLQEAWFGKNKTWRGVVLMPLFTTLGVYLTTSLETQFVHLGVQVSYLGIEVLTGFLFGIAYILAELPNSFIKRRLGIRPGETPQRQRWLFAFFDQADSVFGCLLVAFPLLGVSFLNGLLVLMLGPAIHLIFNSGLYFLGLRGSPL